MHGILRKKDLWAKEKHHPYRKKIKGERTGPNWSGKRNSEGKGEQAHGENFPAGITSKEDREGFQEQRGKRIT